MLVQLAIAALFATEPPIETSLCELMVDPERFDGKLVRFAAKYHREFEGRLLLAGACETWLDWSDQDEDPIVETAVISGLGAFKDPAKLAWQKVTERVDVKLEQDAAYDQVSACLRMQYDGGKRGFCIPSCPLCEVEAVWTGRFDYARRGLLAVRTRSGRIGVGAGGYGHLNSSPHRLVLSGISSVRTSMISKTEYEKGSLVVSLVDGQGERIPIRSAAIEDAVGSKTELKVEADGRVISQRLAPGNYTLLIEGDGEIRLRRRIRIQKYKVLWLDDLRVKP